MLTMNVELTRAFRGALVDLDLVHDFMEELYKQHPRWDDLPMDLAVRLEAFRNTDKGMPASASFLVHQLRKMLLRGFQLYIRGRWISVTQVVHDGQEVVRITSFSNSDDANQPLTPVDFYPANHLEDIISGIRFRCTQPVNACPLANSDDFAAQTQELSKLAE